MLLMWPKDGGINTWRSRGRTGKRMSTHINRVRIQIFIKYFVFQSNARDIILRRRQRRLRPYGTEISNEIFDIDIYFGVAFNQFVGKKTFSDIGTRRRVR